MTITMTDTHHPGPLTDLRRIAAIGAYDLDAPGLRATLDQFAQRAAERLDVRTGLVSIVLDTAQFLAGTYGVEGSWFAESDGTPIEWAFCASVVRTGQPYLVTDATVDELQHDNPLVTIDGIRSYAGAPLIDPDGLVLGSCCAIGDTPRDFVAEEIADLQLLAAEIVAELEQHRAA